MNDELSKETRLSHICFITDALYQLIGSLSAVLTALNMNMKDPDIFSFN